MREAPSEFEFVWDFQRRLGRFRAKARNDRRTSVRMLSDAATGALSEFMIRRVSLSVAVKT
jgi:hypothetical protein